MRKFLFALIYLAGANGCAYQFTNAHVVRPSGVRTIAIEAIYDTSREVLPHEGLWEALQRAFAADGHLRVADRNKADALLRAHITTASVTPTGDRTAFGPEKDSKVFQGGEPPSPSSDAFKRLTTAREFTQKESLNFVVDVEIWNLKTGEGLFKKAYSGSNTFDNFRSSTLPLSYLRYEESIGTQFEVLSDKIAESVVRDLFVR